MSQSIDDDQENVAKSIRKTSRGVDKFAIEIVDSDEGGDDDRAER
ncbi:MAG TPA: hypothetical protein VHF65_06845 [Nitrososphaera sp.]|nr:hypothetical protein [Nitrososphaera sp.]